MTTQEILEAARSAKSALALADNTARNAALLGMADIVVLDVLVILYLVRSANVRAAAAWLFVPYLCWILFATYLNAYILVANGTGL